MCNNYILHDCIVLFFQCVPIIIVSTPWRSNTIQYIYNTYNSHQMLFVVVISVFMIYVH